MSTKTKSMPDFNVTVPGHAGKPESARVARDLTRPSNGYSPTLELHHAGELDYDHAIRLRNWLNDWLGMHGRAAIRTIS